MDFVGRKILLQLANELPKALSALSYRGGERAIELAVKQELPVLGIEAHDIGWQHIDGEIRRELRNVFAVMQRKAASVIACHEVSTRIFATTPTPVHDILAVRSPRQAADVASREGSHHLGRARNPDARIAWAVLQTSSLP